MMNKKILFTLLVMAGMLVSTTGSVAAPGATPLGQAFTYQGRLDRDGQPFSGLCNFQFKLWDDPSAGSQVGSTVSQPGLMINDGLFTTQLDFGAGAFNGEARWLEVLVLCGSDSGYTTLGRQALTAAPYALYALGAPWGGLTGVPAGFADDVDDDTTYSAGEGLELDGTEFAIDPDQTQRRVAEFCATGYSIRVVNTDGSVVCEKDDGATYSAGNGLSLAGTTFSIDPAYTQRRVGGSCAVGSTIRTINSDGSVECQMDAPLNRSLNPSDIPFSTLDSIGDVGTDSSLTLGIDGLGLISYYDNTNGNLKVAHCNDPSCSTTSNYMLDSSGDVGIDISITIGSDGLGLISYYDITNQDLKVAHCNDINCSSASLFTIDSSGNVGRYTSTTIGTDGLGLISYHDGTNYDLKLAHCSNIQCSNATTYTLDSTGFTGYYTSITIVADGFGLISYRSDQDDGNLKVAHCNNIICSSATTYLLGYPGNDCWFTSITTGADGMGIISFINWAGSALKLAHCNYVNCNSATFTTLDTGADVGMYPSITIGEDGFGLISYYNANYGNLKVAHCDSTKCSSASIYTLDSTGNIGMWTSITIGADGMGLISYYDGTNSNLKVGHCSNTLCIPYFRRR
jgi:hypothetical protein